jgi:hypothetical protein
MAKGGKREGAGRKVALHTIQSQKLRAYLIARVLKEQGPLVDALIFEAKNGNVPALKEVFERAIGKVPNVLEPGGDGEFELPFTLVIKRKDETA